MKKLLILLLFIAGFSPSGTSAKPILTVTEHNEAVEIIDSVNARSTKLRNLIQQNIGTEASIASAYEKIIVTKYKLPSTQKEYTILELGVLISDARFTYTMLRNEDLADKILGNSLHYAAELDNPEILSMIIDAYKKNKISMDVRNDKQRTPLHIAIMVQNIPAVKLLLDAGANWLLRTNTKNGALHLAVLTNNSELLETIMSHESVTEELLDRNIDAYGSDKKTPISLAIEEEKRHHLIPILLKHKRYFPLLFDHLTRQDIPLIIKLFEMFDWQVHELISIDMYPVEIAAYFRSPELLQYLIDRGLAVNYQYTNDKSTALHFAVECDALDCIQLLLAQPDINVNACDAKGNSIIAYAIQSNAFTSFDYLIKHPGIDLHATNPLNGNTLLHTAVDTEKPNSIIIHVLLGKGLKLDAKNSLGITPQNIITHKGIELVPSATEKTLVTTKGKRKRKKKANKNTKPRIATSPTVTEINDESEAEEHSKVALIAPDNREQEIRSAAITDFVQNDLLASILNRATTIVDEKYTAAKTYIEKFGKHRLVLVDEQKPASPSGSKRSKQTQKIAHFEDNIGGIYHKIRLFNTRGQRALAKTPVFDQEINYIPQIQKRHTLVDQLCEIDPSYVTRHDGTANEPPCFSVNMSNGNYRQDLKNLLSDAQHPTIGDKQDLNHLYSLRVDEKVRQFGIVEEFNIDTTKVEVTIPGELSYTDQDGNEQIKLGFFQYGFSPDERCIHRCFRQYDNRTPFITSTLKNALKIFVESNFDELATDENREQVYEDCIKRLAC